MALDGLDGDEQLLGDLRIRRSLGGEPRSLVEHMFEGPCRIKSDEPARLRLLVPDEPAAVARLTDALNAQSDPPILVAKDGTAVLAVECATGELMLRSRVIQALQETYGADWPQQVETID